MQNRNENYMGDYPMPDQLTITTSSAEQVTDNSDEIDDEIGKKNDIGGGINTTQNSTIRNINDIQAILPHRYPFLLLDRVLETQGLDYAYGLKAVSINEPFFVGHFPNCPIMPGVLQIEAMAQLAAFLAGVHFNKNHSNLNVRLAKVEEARFKHEIIPGDVLHIYITRTQAKLGKFLQYEGVIKVDDRIVCTSKFLASS